MTTHQPSAGPQVSGTPHRQIQRELTVLTPAAISPPPHAAAATAARSPSTATTRTTIRCLPTGSAAGRKPGPAASAPRRPAVRPVTRATELIRALEKLTAQHADTLTRAIAELRTAGDIESAEAEVHAARTSADQRVATAEARAGQAEQDAGLARQSVAAAIARADHAQAAAADEATRSHAPEGTPRREPRTKPVIAPPARPRRRSPGHRSPERSWRILLSFRVHLLKPDLGTGLAPADARTALAGRPPGSAASRRWRGFTALAALGGSGIPRRGRRRRRRRRDRGCWRCQPGRTSGRLSGPRADTRALPALSMRCQ